MMADDDSVANSGGDLPIPDGFDVYYPFGLLGSGYVLKTSTIKRLWLITAGALVVLFVGTILSSVLFPYALLGIAIAFFVVFRFFVLEPIRRECLRTIQPSQSRVTSLIRKGADRVPIPVSLLFGMGSLAISGVSLRAAWVLKRAIFVLPFLFFLLVAVFYLFSFVVRLGSGARRVH